MESTAERKKKNKKQQDRLRVDAWKEGQLKAQRAAAQATKAKTTEVLKNLSRSQWMPLRQDTKECLFSDSLAKGRSSGHVRREGRSKSRNDSEKSRERKKRPRQYCRSQAEGYGRQGSQGECPNGYSIPELFELEGTK